MNSVDAKRLEEFENEVNREINRLRREETAYRSGDDREWNNHPKVKELMHRLQVARDRHSGVMRGPRAAVATETAEREPPPGVSEGSPGAHAATPPDVLSSPYAGAEPRYAVQYQAVPGGEIRPDPIEKAAPTPPSVAMGATSPEEARLMADVGDPQQMAREFAGKRDGAALKREAAAQQQQAEEDKNKAQPKK